MRERWLVALALVVAVLLPAPASAQQGAPVVVVGVAGLRWSDVTAATPALQALTDRGAVGSLSVKGLPTTTCRADGWLTLGAGTRAEAYGGSRPCDDVLPTDLGRQAGLNLTSRDGAVVGLLGQALGGRVEAVGPGAALALGTAGRAGARLRVVDAGSVDAGGRPASLAAVDAAVARVVADLPADADLLLVGLAEATGEDAPRLHVALATGPSFPRGALRSGSTRRNGHVQLVDVAPTVLDLLDVPVPDAVDGRPWTVSGPAPDLAALVDEAAQAQGQREATVPFFVVLLGVPLALVGLLRRRPRAAELVALSATAGLGASYLANLVPWWRAGVPLLGLLAVVVPLAVAVAVAARRLTAGRGAGPARAAQAVCGSIALVLLVDLLTGARLQLSSVAGYSPLVAGRFAGIGNVAFGVLAASVLLAASASRRATTIAAVGLVAVVVDGAPPYGSDVGGVLALVPAFVLLAMLRTGTRVTLTRLLLAGGGAAAVVTAFALADWSRPPADRTHLGRFVEDVVDGTAGQVLARKAGAVLDLLLLSPVTALLPVVVAAAVYLVVRPPAPLRTAFDAAPGWRHGLTAVGLASLLGFALNDSGAAVPALAVCVALPATLAVVLAAQRARRPPAGDRGL